MVAKGLAQKKFASGRARQPWWRGGSTVAFGHRTVVWNAGKRPGAKIQTAVPEYGPSVYVRVGEGGLAELGRLYVRMCILSFQFKLDRRRHQSSRLMRRMMGNYNGRGGLPKGGLTRRLVCCASKGACAFLATTGGRPIGSVLMTQGRTWPAQQVGVGAAPERTH